MRTFKVEKAEDMNDLVTQVGYMVSGIMPPYSLVFSPQVAELLEKASVDPKIRNLSRTHDVPRFMGIPVEVEE